MQSDLNQAKKAKNDEFYTQFNDIQREMNCYYLYDKNFLRDKTVLCPCDDPEWSNFTEFFAQNFGLYGLKKLISTSYASNSKKVNFHPQISLFESESPQFDPAITDSRGKIFVMTEETAFYPADLRWEYLEGDGDFRSDEVKKLRDEADVIITNPPFSLFREFLKWILDADKQFLIIGNKNCITYKEVFQLIKENKIWLGAMPMGRDLLFKVPREMEESFISEKNQGSMYRVVDNEIFARSSAVWFTNLDHGRRHEPLRLITMDQNLRHSKHKIIKEQGYPKYDNYDAIEVPFYDAIPDDYDGVMGVPITFLNRYCPEQFEIIGIAKRGAGDPALRTKVYTNADYPNYSDLNAGPVLMKDGVLRNTYPRILIRRR